MAWLASNAHFLDEVDRLLGRDCLERGESEMRICLEWEETTLE
jgi:hypothetical protein